MKLIYSPNLTHAYIVTEKQLAKLIYNCVGIYCCVVDCSSIHQGLVHIVPLFFKAGSLLRQPF